MLHIYHWSSHFFRRIDNVFYVKTKLETNLAWNCIQHFRQKITKNIQNPSDQIGLAPQKKWNWITTYTPKEFLQLLLVFTIKARSYSLFGFLSRLSAQNNVFLGNAHFQHLCSVFVADLLVYLSSLRKSFGSDELFISCSCYLFRV